MSSTQQTSIQDRVRDLQRYIQEGRIIEALEEFYDPEVVMQDNLEQPTQGLAANVEREQAWLDSVSEWRGFEVLAIAVQGDTSFAETSMDFVTKDGQVIHQEQTSRAVWRAGKIVSERFYHA